MSKNKVEKLDVLAFGAHPDDVEAGCGGMVAFLSGVGKKVGIIDLSQAELSTNGTVEERKKESAAAADILGVRVRENLEMPNNFFFNSKETQGKIIDVIRKYKPDMVLMPYWFDRHPDHESVRSLLWPALFTSGLLKYESFYDRHRPEFVFFYRLWYEFTPSFIFDISDHFETKMESIRAYESQFSKGKGRIETKDNEKQFFDFWHARHVNDGYQVGVKYGEPYLSATPLGVRHLDSFLPNYS